MTCKCLHIISRDTARSLGMKRYFTGIVCKHGHISERSTLEGKCSQCQKESRDRYYQNNRETILSQKSEYSKTTDRSDYLKEYRRRSKPLTRRFYDENKDRLNQQRREHYAANVECFRARSEKYRKSNRAGACERSREWRILNPDHARQYRQNNPELFAFHAASRRALTLSATPAWSTGSDRKKIKLIYMLRKTKSSWTRVHHHVDHIVPLNGKNVCGLHVPWNLKIIPAIENQSKNNRHE